MKEFIYKILKASILTLALIFCSACIEDLQEMQSGGKEEYTGMVELNVPFQLSSPMEVNFSTKAEDSDSQVAGIMIFVYRKDPSNTTNDPTKDKRVAFHLLAPEGHIIKDATGTYKFDPNTQDRGTLQFSAPAGEAYIYIIGNCVGSFVDFGLTPNPPTDILASRADFLKNVKGHWYGTVVASDGYMPIIGKVNNTTGLCKIVPGTTALAPGKPLGTITYIDDNNIERTISSTSSGTTETLEQLKNRSFVLDRLMAKLTMEFKSGPNCKFVPLHYALYRCPSYIKALPESVLTPEDTKVFTDKGPFYFQAATPNKFTVYIPENIQPYTGEKITNFHQRDQVLKNPDGTNAAHPGRHYKFKYAPDYATYAIVKGMYDGPVKDANGLTVNSSADVHYIIHLGDIAKDLSDFSVKRDHHYTYTVTVNGVDNIGVEVNTGTEQQSSVEGIVFEGGLRAELDAHFEQVEIRFSKGDYPGAYTYIYSSSPFGIISGKYEKGGKWTDTGVKKCGTIDKVKPFLKWVELAKQTKGKGFLAPYPGEGKGLDIFSALEEFWASNQQEAYYTCFIDEYYYRPQEWPEPSTGDIPLSKFINTTDRVFSLASDLKYSADKHSAVASSVYLIHQTSIDTFYDMTDYPKMNVFGVENADEGSSSSNGLSTGGVVLGNYSNGAASDEKTGRINTINRMPAVADRYGKVNWEKNGWLLSANGDDLINMASERFVESNIYAECLSRNRDLNGDKILQDNEIIWYIPARDQLVGLWVGEPALPKTAALFSRSLDELDKLTGAAKENVYYPIVSSTYDQNNKAIYIWAEQGCTYGEVPRTSTTLLHLRAVRNLGCNDRSTISAANPSYTLSADPYYKYDKPTQTIEVYLADAAMRGISYRELAPHTERDELNRLYKKIQVAKEAFNIPRTFECQHHYTNSYKELVTSNAVTAKTGVTEASFYEEKGNILKEGDPAWRLPNQVEIALMEVAMGADFDLILQNDVENTKVLFPTGPQGCNSWLFGHYWKGAQYTVETIHCRTAFSKNSRLGGGSQYTAYGYMYNAREQKLQMMWDNAYGMGVDGTAGYLCVRDVK